ncbi:MAG: hypothetical protein ACREEM_13275 [Blastocatellia bacterium]
MEDKVNIIRYGKDEPLAEQSVLRAGPLSAVFEAGDLRYIKLGEHEIIRRVYAAVRDRNWGTIPAAISILKLEIGDDSFRICCESEHRAGEIDFVWRGTISGAADGTVVFTMEGEARSTFLRNRIGFCVLHPAECAGRRCRADYVNGSSFTTSFPELVTAQQPVTALHDLRGLAHEVMPGLWAEVSFAGDLFETEDQRNWIDASYKTFCTPLRIPFPLEIRAGTRITQSVELRLREEAPGVISSISLPGAREAREAVTLRLMSERRFPLPPFGLGMASHARQLSEREVARLAALQPAHLRVDLPLSEDGCAETLRRAAREARLLGVPLEIAVFITGRAEAELQRLTALLDQLRPRVLRWLIFHAAEKTSGARWLRLAREALASYGAPVGGGTNADFYQLNQFRPPVELLDFVSFSMNPQAHAFDNGSLVETLAAHQAPVRSAQHYFNGLPVIVSPVTLKPRFNTVATGAVAEPAPDELPPQVDPRQMSLFGAVWTLGSLKYLALSEVAGVTYYETTGWRGVMETAEGAPVPDRFPSLPGAVFPLYHVLADFAGFAGGEAVDVHSDNLLNVEGVMLDQGERQALLVANLTNKRQTAVVHGVGQAATIRRLNETNAGDAMREAEKFRAHREKARPEDNRLELLPYEFVRLDLE